MQRFFLLLVLLALILLAFFCIRHHAAAIEADIASRSSAHLAEAGLGGVAVSANGRNVILEGSVASEDQKMFAEDGVRGLAGVANLDNRLQVDAPETVPAASVEPVSTAPTEGALQLITTLQGITLSGSVPDAESRTRWVAAAETAFGAERVLDKLEIDVASNFSNLDRSADELLATLADGQTGVRTQLYAAKVHLLGTVSSEEARLAPERAVRIILPMVEIQNDIEVDLRQQELQLDIDRILQWATVEFRTSSAELTTEGQQVLDQMIEPLTRAAGYQVRVEGHTDSSGDDAMNLALSQARARSVVDYLIANGIDPSIIHPQGFGETRPIMSNENPEGRRRNRRIELRLAREN